MNWTHRRPFRNQFNYGGGINKGQPNRSVTYGEHFYVPKDISDQPIDAIRLQLADYDGSYYHPCPVHNPRRHNPYITTLSDHPSSPRRTHSSIHSVSTFETDFVHQVSTIHTCPSSPSIIQRQTIIDQDNQPIQHNQLKNINLIQQQQQKEKEKEKKQQSNESNHCDRCVMLIEIVDQQTQQIRQYTEQISEQADLLAKLARRIAAIDEAIDDQKSDNTSQQHQIDNLPIST